VKGIDVMKRFNVRRAAWLYAFILLLSAAAPVSSADLSTNLRMQNVVKQFAVESNQQVVGMGSWISGKNYTDVLSAGASDHDLRLVVPRGANEAVARRQWQEARGRLATLIEKEFGKDAGKVMNTVNLYPPTQLMRGVEDLADAQTRYAGLGQVPNLGYREAVSAATPAKYAEGLYGAGSKVWTDAYEESAGRLFYSRDGKAFMGMTDLTHLSEGVERYSVSGMSNTSGQWIDHVAEELTHGRGDKVAKYIERIDRDLAKAKSLARVDMDVTWRNELRELAKTLKENPGRLGSLQRDIDSAMSRARMESSILGCYERTGASGRKILNEALADIQKQGRLSRLWAKVGDSVPSGTIAMGILLYIQTRETVKAAGEEDFQKAYNEAFIAAVGTVNLPAGLVAELAKWTLDSAAATGVRLAASTQEAWDLMAGIYTAVGRTDVDAGRAYTLDDLVRHIHAEDRLRAVVWAKSWMAASRDLGRDNSRVDQKVAEAIFNRCYPVIFTAWQSRREALAIEYLQLAQDVASSPVLLTYQPVPAELSGGKPLQVTVTAHRLDKDLDRHVERMKQILDILLGKGTFASFYYEWAGGKEGRSPYERIYEYTKPGRYPAKLTLKVNSGALSLEWNSYLNQRLAVKSGLDVEVIQKGAKKEEPQAAVQGAQEIEVHLTVPIMVRLAKPQPQDKPTLLGETLRVTLGPYSKRHQLQWNGRSFSLDAEVYLPKDAPSEGWPRGRHRMIVTGSLDETGRRIQGLQARMSWQWEEEKCPWAGDDDRYSLSFSLRDIPFLGQYADSTTRKTQYSFTLEGVGVKERVSAISYTKRDCYHSQYSYDLAGIDWSKAASYTPRITILFFRR
jgi:hypothetical protein